MGKWSKSDTKRLRDEALEKDRNEFNLPYQTVNGRLEKMDGFEPYWKKEFLSRGIYFKDGRWWGEVFVSAVATKDELEDAWQEATKQVHKQHELMDRHTRETIEESATLKERERTEYLVEKALRKLGLWEATGKTDYALKAISILEEINP